MKSQKGVPKKRKGKLPPPPAPPPPPMGRPTDYTPELAAHICRRLANGESLRAMCREDESLPDRGTICGWAYDGRHEDFSRQYAEATKIRAELWAEEAVAISDSNEQDPIRARLMVDTRKWAASHLLRHKYGEKLEVTHLTVDDLLKDTDDSGTPSEG